MRDGRWTTYLHNARQQTTDVFDPEGGHTKYEYCVCGALLALVDAENHRTEWEYDLQLRPIWKKYADGTKLDYGYEQTTSRLHSVTDAKAQVKTYGYDKRNHLTQITYSNALKPTPNVTFHYDALGRQDYRIDGTGQTDFTFYPMTAGQLGAGRPQTSEGPGSNDTLTFAYDAAGKVVSETADGATETVGIDYLGRLTSRDNPLGHQGLFYVGNGRRPDYVDYPNGLRAVYGYYPASKNLWLNTLLYRRPDLTQVSKFTYDYDAMGSITSWKQERAAASQGWQWAYRYDRTDQLKLAGATGLGAGFGTRSEYYSYDKAGNRLSRQIDATVRKETPNALNQLVMLGGGGKLSIHGTVSEPAVVKVGGRDATMLTATEFAGEIDTVAGSNGFTVSARDGAGNTTIKGYQVSVAAVSGTAMLYDLNGNLTSEGTRTYEWDAENRLVGISYGNGTSTEMQYDGLGRRVKILEKQGTTIQQTKTLLWSRASLRAERLIGTSPDTSSVKRFYADGVQINGQNYYHTKDHLGSIREMVDASRTVRARYEYDSWGKATKVEGDLSSDLLYTGHYLHVPSGLYLTWYRAYNPDTARWLSRDPLGERAGINLYGYVANNPVSFWDPFGLDTYSANRKLSGDQLRSNYNPLTHTFCYTTNPDGSLKHTYSWGNSANTKGWNKDQPEDRKAANQAIETGGGQKEGGEDLDPKVDKAFDDLNKKENEHNNGLIMNNCKAETKKLLDKAKSYE